VLLAILFVMTIRTVKKAINMIRNIPGSLRRTRNIIARVGTSLAAVLRARSRFGLSLCGTLLTVSHNPPK
jgi:hypothetical protein